MSDGLTTHPASPELLDARPETAQRPAWVVVPAQALASCSPSPWSGRAARLCSGTGSGTSRSGVVAGHQWYTSEAGLRDDFAGIGWYVAIACSPGCCWALAAWFFDRSELVTLVAVVVGSVLAAYLMLRVGYHLSPPDPDELARTAAGRHQAGRSAPGGAGPRGARSPSARCSGWRWSTPHHRPVRPTEVGDRPGTARRARLERSPVRARNPRVGSARLTSAPLP